MKPNALFGGRHLTPFSDVYKPLTSSHTAIRNESNSTGLVSESHFREAYSGSFYKRMQYRLGMSEANIFKLRQSTVYLYESCTDKFPYEKFFQEFELEDTFFSFFLILELHLWMCYVRSMREGKEGRILRNELTERLWVDIDKRLTRVDIFSKKKRKEILEDLLYHLQASIFSYDEGLMSDDKVLAGALWRNLFQMKDIDPRKLETSVDYVRNQLEHLKSIGPREWCIEGKLTWKKHPPIID